MHACHFPACPVPVARQRTQGSGIRQQRLGPRIQAGAVVQVGNVAEHSTLARRLDAPPILLTKPRDHAQPQANRRLLAVDRLQAAIPVTGQHIHRADLQAVAPRILQDLVRAVETHGPAVDQGTGERRRFMALEPATGVGQQGKTGRMGLGEAIAAKAFDLLENLRGKFLAVAVLEHAGAQTLLMRFQAAVAFPGGHGAAQLVGFAWAIVGGNHGDLHHLFLEQRHAQGAFQHCLKFR